MITTSKQKQENISQHKTTKLHHAELCFSTLNLNAETNLDAILNLYRDFLFQLKNQGFIPVYEKIVGDDTLKLILTEEREKIEWFDFPSSFINYQTVMGGPLSSIFIYAIKILNHDNCSIRYISKQAVEVNLGDCSHLYILGLNDNNSKKTDQGVFEDMFSNLEAQLHQNEYSPKNLVHTWFYLRKIKQNYPGFNLARRLFFDRNGVNYTDNALTLPSSTCIGAPICEENVYAADIYCIRHNNASTKVSRMFNEKQNEANGTNYLFQPTFARATEIIEPDYTKIHVSGTASINQNGESINLNDSYNQILTTLNHVKSLLNQHDMNFEHLVQSTCFFKRKEYYSDFLMALEALGLQNFSQTFVIGDVCRDELLFELDGIAVKKH